MDDINEIQPYALMYVYITKCVKKSKLFPCNNYLNVFMEKSVLSCLMGVYHLSGDSGTPHLQLIDRYNQ